MTQQHPSREMRDTGNMHSLNHLHILVTRPFPQGEMLCQYIREQGDLVTHYPVIAFESFMHQAVVVRQMATLDMQDWVIFNSPEAVFQSIPFIQKKWPPVAFNAKLAAIGRGTEKALLDAGYTNVLVPVLNFNSEGLLALPCFQQVAQKRIAIIQGEGGLLVLDRVLSSRGAVVTVIACYRRVLRAQSSAQCLSLLKTHQVDAIILTSGDGLRYFKILFGQVASSIPIIVPSERLKQLALNLGFQLIWVARNASHTALFAVLIENRDVLCRMKVDRQR